MKIRGVPTDPLWDMDDPDLINPPWPDVTVTENPVVAELLGPNGQPIRQWTERPPFGFQPNRTRSTTA